MKPLTADFNASELGRRHALLGMRCAGVVYAVIDQVEYERAYAAAIAETGIRPAWLVAEIIGESAKCA